MSIGHLPKIVSMVHNNTNDKGERLWQRLSITQVQRKS